MSSDSINRSKANDNEDFEHLTLEFLSCLKTSGLPNHSMNVKIGTCIMLIRNLNQCEGFVRLTVTRLDNHIIEVKIISSTHTGNIIYILKMSLSPSQSLCPFKLIRRQFPIIISFAMIINKFQGQLWDFVDFIYPKISSVTAKYTWQCQESRPRMSWRF